MTVPATTRVASQVSRGDAPPRTPLAVRRMSPAELKERREKGPCYNCNERFEPGHRCKKLFLIEACTTEEDGDLDMEVEGPFEEEAPGISLHAISGG